MPSTKLRNSLKEGQTPFLTSFLIFWAATAIPSSISVPKEEEEGRLPFCGSFLFIDSVGDSLSVEWCGIIACECPLGNFRARARDLLEVASSKYVTRWRLLHQ